ncbi:class D sortase [Sutcliffiella horikoshii]|nr:class D sortase [Sutcliffiella horikoshii]
MKKEEVLESVGEFDVAEHVAVTIKAGEEIGEISFPVLDVSIPVFHGVSEEELVKGVGHVPGTLLPGDGGNIVLSGHRDTVFRRLKELEVGDKVMFGFDGGWYTYKIGRIRVVDKEDTSVVVPRPREVLTITTCYPFTFIGRAPQRYVVEAEFIGRVE